MRFPSNHLIGLLDASSFTLVGLTRVSTGPAISVMLLRLRRVLRLRHDSDGGEHLHAGLADAPANAAPRPEHAQPLDQVVDIILEAECARGKQGCRAHYANR